MSILPQRPGLRRPRLLRVDRGHRPDAAGGQDPSPSVAELASAFELPAVEPSQATPAEQIAAWFDGEVRLAYPVTWEEICPNELRGRVWGACGLTPSEFRELAGPIVRGGHPLDELVGRIAEALTGWVVEKSRQAEEAERRRRQERKASQAAGDRAMALRLVGEAAAIFERSAGLALLFDRHDESVVAELSFDGREEADRQAADAKQRAEQSLAARLEWALPRLAPGLAARDGDGWPVPFGIVSDGAAYLVIGDAESADPGTIVARVPLDRIVGLP